MISDTSCANNSCSISHNFEGTSSSNVISKENSPIIPKPLSDKCAFDLDGYKGKIGLYAENGKVMYKGKEFRGIGFNYYDGFIQFIENDMDLEDQLIKDFQKMRENCIPFVRMNFSQFWPITYRKYAENKKYYYESMDKVVKNAEEYGIGIIPTLFWHPQGTTDFCDEPFNAWGDPNSRTRAFMTEYVKEVVDRYKASPAIWAWEFSNEFNLACDLPNAAERREYTIAPHLGTRLTRDENDDMTTNIMSSAMKAFAEEVRKYDRDRIISSGNASPRPSAYNMYSSLSWQYDTQSEMAEILKLQNPEELELVSVHIYGDEKRINDEMTTVEGLIKAIKEECDKMNRPLFIGEFGGDVRDFGLETMHSQFKRVLDAALENKVSLLCVWSAWINQSRLTDNILRNPDHQYVLDTVREQNLKLFDELGINIW